MSFSFLLSTVLFSFASGQPQPWQMGLSESVTPIMTELLWFHDDFLLWIIGFVTFFVLFLLIVVVLFFNKRFHPVPSTTSHNTAIEVIWTVIPILILIVIAVPSFRLLYFERVIPEAAMTIKAIGHQWYWSYEYPDHEDVSFDSVMVEDEDLKAGQPRLLAVDQELIVPVGKVVRLLVTASDVIHSWAIPSFGMKIDAIPGRLNESWFKAEKVGVYYGQCSELCGVRHAFMPIAVRVVEQEIFDAWITMAVQSGPEDANELLTHRHKILSRTVSLKNGG
ncbi:MAG: cytochrome c oxidase subunit II [Alphaproteobacteria bacterium]|nr:cytochrome c oxidase subunit II [Alphaproteobacteria bacterium]